MGFKTFASMNIAIIGDSAAGHMYAQGFAQAGHNIFMAQAANGGQKNRMPTAGDYEATLCSIEDAAVIADLIIIATEPKDVRESAYWLGDVRRKVIIDVTGNVPTPDEDLVNTFNAIKSITGSPHVVKAFNTRGYEQLVKPLFNAMPVELLLAGDSKKAKEITKIMAVELGITQWDDFGGIDTLPLFNQLTRSLRHLAEERKMDTAYNLIP